MAVAGVGDDRDVRRADHAAVAGVAHRVVQFHDDAAGGLVDDRPQRRKRHHVTAREGRHRLLNPGAHLLAPVHRAGGVLDVFDVGVYWSTQSSQFRVCAARATVRSNSPNAADSSSRLNTGPVTSAPQDGPAHAVRRFLEGEMRRIVRRPAPANSTRTAVRPSAAADHP
ncbi:hypothetical protein BZL29_5855 [Mycobacterium kansasii]|uniref:Uncharacterized protein n=1 Tax=Mycobacterium kansasii TaxID=1768 RepID=A0A1V3WWF4_MYCKA|nr:hypothetical protein BZL29_5855 [Mycobacterium kansasii]